MQERTLARFQQNLAVKMPQDNKLNLGAYKKKILLCLDKNLSRTFAFILDFHHVSFAQSVFVLQHQLFDLLCFLAAPPLDERVDVI